MSKYLIFTTQFYQIGGIERLAVELAIELNRKGADVDLLSQYTSILHNANDASQKINAAGVERIFYLGLNIKPNFIQFLIAVMRLRKLVKKEGYEAIEVSSFTPSLLTVLATWGLDLKIIFGVHDIYDRKRYGGARFYIWRKLLVKSRKIAFYAISKSAARGWCSYLQIKEENIKVISNNINSEYFLKKRKQPPVREVLNKIVNIPNSSKVVLFVGRLMHRKGLDIVYDALKYILVEHDLHLVLVGRHDESERPQDKELIRTINVDIKKRLLDDRVHFVGLRNDVVDLMFEADILLHPARIEGFGLVLAEALATGLPIIASNVDGIPEVLSNTDAVMIDSPSPENIKNAVIDMLKIENYWTTESIRNRRNSALRFKPHIRAQELLRLFQAD